MPKDSSEGASYHARVTKFIDDVTVLLIVAMAFGFLSICVLTVFAP